MRHLRLSTRNSHSVCGICEVHLNSVLRIPLEYDSALRMIEYI